VIEFANVLERTEMATEPDLASMSKVLDLIAVEVGKNGLATAELRREMIAGFGRIHDRLGGVEGRLGGVEGRLGGVEGRLGGVEVRLGRLETRIEDLEGGMKAVRGDIADLKRRSR
jgi:archaellum component FlaC